MNGLEKIIERILSDARAKANEYTTACEEEIKAMKQGALDEILNMEIFYMSQSERQSAELFSRAQSSWSLEANDIILSQKNALVDEAFEVAKRKILSLGDKEYVDLISGARAYALKEREEVRRRNTENGVENDDVIPEAIFNESDNKKRAKQILQSVKKSVPEGTPIVLSKELAEIDGGFILKCGEMEINCSLSTILSEVRKVCEAKVIKALFQNN